MEDSEVNISIVEEEENFKVCADCSHLIGVRYSTDKVSDRWHCGHSNNIHEDDKIGWRVDFVTGLKYRVYRIANAIYTIREQHCKGDWYEKYVPPVRETRATIGGSEATEIIFDQDTLASGAAQAAERVRALKEKKNKKTISPSDPDLNRL